MERNIRQVLALCQRELSVPKDQYNAFGKYKFRNLESINLALKPICERHKCGYLLTDEPVTVDGDEQRVMLLDKNPILIEAHTRYYCKSTVEFFLEEGGETLKVSGYAREEAYKTGMDDAQVSGLASSYARKYAMCGLFAIDSGEEVDAMDNTQAPRTPSKQQKRITEPKNTKQPLESSDNGSLELNVGQVMGLMAKFAKIKGKTTQEVLAAVNATKTMQAAGVTADTVEYTPEQLRKAYTLVGQWIEKAGMKNE